MPHPHLSTLFERVVDMPLDRRVAFLDDACQGDDVLRHELVSLLEAHDAAGGYFENLAQRVGVPALHDALDSSARASIDLMAALQAGLADSYRIERELAGGGMSRVFLAEEIALRRRVVIKTLPPDMAATVNVDRFRREIGVIAQLQHPHIVPLLTANSSGLLLYYTMPYVAGESLRDRLAVSGALPVEEALRIWRDVLDALAHAHANGVIHRDIKPANILLSGRNAMVTDFGIARAIEAAATETGTMMTGPIGTPAYMAPEQATGGKVDRRADFYAAGLVMYEMLTGRPPYQATSAREFVLAHLEQVPQPVRRTDVAPRLAALVMKCLAKDPAARPESDDALIAELDALADPSTMAFAALRRPAVRVAALAGIVLIGTALGAWRISASVSTTSTARAKHVPSDSAVRLYQRGMTEHRRRTVEGETSAMALFDRAIAADSDYSLAWAGRARAAQFAFQRGWSIAGRGPDSLLAIARRASQRAMERDSSSAEVWTVAGKVASSLDLEGRRSTLHALNRAIALDSNYAEAWFELGLAQEELLHPEEAERAWLHAAAISPGNTQVLAFLGMHYLWKGDYVAGRGWADSAYATDPAYFLARDAAAFLALAMNDPARAVQHAEASRRASGHEPPIPPAILAMAAARQGDLTRARGYAIESEGATFDKRRPTKHEAVYLAMAWSAIGDTARAVRWLAAYAPLGDLHYQLHLKRDPELRWIATRNPALLTR